LVAAAIIALQAAATWHTSERARSIISELSSLDESKLTDEKTRGEIAKIRIANELDRFFWHSLITGLLPLVSAAVALVGAWIGLQKYLDARATEGLDRAAKDLTQVLEYLADGDARKRTVGLVGLQHFFSPDKKEYHLRALSALATGARLETDKEALRALRLAMEQALAHVDAKLFQEISWQGVNFSGADLSGRSLDQLDLRDAVIEDADLSGASLAGTQLVNARLNGTDLGSANLRGANLTYADMAGTSLIGADLHGAVFRHTKVLRLNLQDADLTGATFDIDEMRWDLIDNWRQARFDEDAMVALIARFGPGITGPRVLMLLWEAPPLVAGGTWTASYHLVRNLKRMGAQVTVAVPWSEAVLTTLPFGTDVPLVSMGIDPPVGQTSGISPYGSPGAGQGPGAQAPSWSPYSWLGTPSAQSPYGGARGYGAYGRPIGGTAAASPYGRAAPGFVYQAGSGLLHLMETYRRRVTRFAEKNGFELVHAHDWVTFPAARDASAALGVGWVAHFHSTEGERHPGRPDAVVERLEHSAVRQANAIVVPSKTTADRLTDAYDARSDRLKIIPNSLSHEDVPAAEMGSFEARRIVYLGRLTRQKGPDLYAHIARHALKHRGDLRFVAYGEGEGAFELRSAPVHLHGPLDWETRGAAFADASALIVPSRAEPFGMVILEAMQHRTPVFYASGCGAAEVIESGIAIDPENPEDVSEQLLSVLDDWPRWEQVVEKQASEITGYPERGYEQRLMTVWETTVQSHATQAKPS